MEATETSVSCPYCWQNTSIYVDPSIAHQRYIEDCEVCCQPIEFTVECSDGELGSVVAERAQ